MKQAEAAVTAIIFDLDGTLVDSASDLMVAANRLLTELGRPSVELPAVKRMIGDGVRRLVERALEATGEPLVGAALDSAVERFHAIYLEAPSALTQPYPGVLDALALLHARGIRMGVCTNKPVDAASAILRDLGLAPYLSGLSGGDSAGVRKPDPGHVLDALRRIDALPEAAIMVGDNEHDIHVAKAAGMSKSIAVTYGYARLPYAELGADRLIESFEDLVPTLEAMGAI